MAQPQQAQTAVNLPRVAITYCTQCKWMLRAAYFGQELMSTFGTAIGEVALIPATGGIFTVHLTHRPDSPAGATEVQQILLWDRKAENGFPETKILKQRLRNHIEPEKKLGHSDTPASSSSKHTAEAKVGTEPNAEATASLPAKQDPQTQQPEDAKSKECGDCQ
ncbi:hypothetical protein KC349_g7809 [Hortaea werneckii]|nr:hypothetical protein KC349_g7809 [Hortaea werneckii]